MQAEAVQVCNLSQNQILMWLVNSELDVTRKEAT